MKTLEADGWTITGDAKAVVPYVAGGNKVYVTT
jgi:hypothetical protein